MYRPGQLSSTTSYNGMLRHIWPLSKKLHFLRFGYRLYRIFWLFSLWKTRSAWNLGDMQVSWHLNGFVGEKNERRYYKDDWVIDQFSLKFVSFPFKWHLGVLTLIQERYAKNATTLSFSTTHSNMAAAPCITTRSVSSASFSLQVNRNTTEHQIYIIVDISSTTIKLLLSSCSKPITRLFSDHRGSWRSLSTPLSVNTIIN